MDKNGKFQYFLLSDAQRNAVADLIHSFGLDPSPHFSVEKCCVEFFANPTPDGIGFDRNTNGCLQALMAVCGVDKIIDCTVIRNASPHSGGTQFKDGYCRVIAIPIMREPFPMLSPFNYSRMIPA